MPTSEARLKPGEAKALRAAKVPDDDKTAVMKDQEALLDRLAEAGGKLTAEEDIKFRGSEIVLPEVMELTDAIEFLVQKQREDEHGMSFRRSYNYRPWDGARATLRALKKAFGMVRQKSIWTFFGERLPELLTIPTGVNETEQVPWGAMAVPVMPGTTLYLGSEAHPEMGPLFVLAAEGPRKYRHHIEGIFRMVEDELKKDSLYRGKAFDGQTKPEFLDLTGVDPDKVIYAEDVMVQLEANLWSLIRYRKKMEALSVPLKRAVLFEGPYGTGKTLGAYLTAKIAVEHDWTFLYCRPGRDDLNAVMATARLYQPAVVFYEDMDTVAGSEGNAQDNVARLLDNFDGIQAKGTQIIIVLTTNHAERIHKGMVRPGRLDAVIHIGATDRAGVRRMAEALVPAHLLATDIDWDRVGESMEGFLPAFVSEAVQRSVRYNVARNEGEPSVLTTEDFVNAADGLRPQLELMEGAKEMVKPDALTTAVGDVVRSTINGAAIDADGDPEWGVVRVEGNGKQLARR